MLGNKNEKKEKNKFGDKNYQMKDYYDADNLFVARLARVSSEFIDCSPMIEETNLKYTFERFIDGEKEKYREVFTGFIADTEGTYFDLPYVINIFPFTYYFPETKGKKIPKLSLIWAQNDINYRKKKSVKVRARKIGKSN